MLQFDTFIENVNIDPSDPEKFGSTYIHVYVSEIVNGSYTKPKNARITYQAES